MSETKLCYWCHELWGAFIRFRPLTSAFSLSPRNGDKFPRPLQNIPRHSQRRLCLFSKPQPEPECFKGRCQIGPLVYQVIAATTYCRCANEQLRRGNRINAPFRAWPRLRRCLGSHGSG